MEIQLKQFHNGKPILKLEQHQLQQKFQKLVEEKKLEDALALTKHMQESKEKYLLTTTTLLQMRRWRELAQSCEQGLKIDKDQSQFYHLKGKALGKLGDHAQQIELMLKAISINPYVATYHRNLGAGYYAQKQYEKAIECHQKAIELEPDNPINYHNIGSAFFRIKEYEKAKSNFDQAIKKKPNQALSYSWKGDCLKQQGKLEEALECYQQAYILTHSAVYLSQKEKVEEMIKFQKGQTDS